jgi:hypothetical protein
MDGPGIIAGLHKTTSKTLACPPIPDAKLHNWTNRRDLSSYFQS